MTRPGPDEPVGYGIDFGTSNSTIAVAYRDRTEILPVETRSIVPEIVPSLVYLNRDRNRAAGQEAIEQFLVTGPNKHKCGNCPLVVLLDGKKDSACKQYKAGGECQDSRVISGVKSFLAETDFTQTHSWSIDFTLDDLVAVVLRRLKRAADRATGVNVPRVVLGHPVIFVGAEGPGWRERQDRAKARLRDAALQAGFTEVELLEEPVAAMNGEALQEGIAVAVDFGGGTFDVSVIKYAPDGGDVLALTGAPIGGESFDKRLFHTKVAPALGLPKTLPKSLWDNLATLGGLNFLLNDKHAMAALNKSLGWGPSPVHTLLRSGYAYEFYRAIEEAKIGLSAETSAIIDFHRPGVDAHRPRIDVSVKVERVEFEAMIADDLQTVRDEILTALERSGVGPENVSLVVRTGGSSSIPAFVRILEDIFDPAIIQKRPAYTTVAEGLARQAWQLWA